MIVVPILCRSALANGYLAMPHAFCFKFFSALICVICGERFKFTQGFNNVFLNFFG